MTQIASAAEGVRVGGVLKYPEIRMGNGSLRKGFKPKGMQRFLLLTVSSILLPLIIFALPLILAVILIHQIHRLATAFIVRLKWIPQGKFSLIITSDSPAWASYMERKLIPKFEEHSVVINWSERKKWSKKSLATHVFYAFGGSRNHTPAVIFFDPWWRPKIYRFFKPFRAFKHGRSEEVDQLFSKLETDFRLRLDSTKQQGSS